MSLRLLVCGSRDYSDQQAFAYVMGLVEAGWGPFDRLFHGAARGADTMAGDWAAAWGIPVKTFPADWAAHGRAAGPIRNAQMLEVGKPDLVVAFPAGRLADSRGTADMVTKAVAARIEVLVVQGRSLVTHDGHPIPSTGLSNGA